MAARIGRLLVLAFLSLLCASPVFAQEGVHKSANFSYKYDVASTTLTYCKTAGLNGDPYGTAYKGPGTVETSADVVTITTVDASGAFALVSVGDIIYVNGLTRVIITNADDDTITVDTSLDLTAGYIWSYKNMSCGTGITDGWISTAGYSTVQLGLQYDAGDLTILSATWECIGGATGASRQRIYPGVASDCGDGTLNGAVCEFTTVGDALTYKLTDNVFSACRIGVAYVTADGATVDEVTATIDVGRP